MIHDEINTKFLGLYNDDEQLIGLMTNIHGDPLFQLHNKQGIPRLTCMVNKEGNPQINLLTPGGMSLAALHVTSDSSARFVLCNQYGARLLEIETENDTTTIKIRDAEDEIVREL